MRRGLLLVALLGSSLALPPSGLAEPVVGPQHVLVILGTWGPQLGADLTEEPVVVGRALPGAHTVRVVAVDRAGNRSRPALRRIETQ
ncbi:MAG: hypothetical protein H0W90_10930 [Actinobacteria bacterium]|nr:hypothetical protein [Actinomycetota bacterium]